MPDPAEHRPPSRGSGDSSLGGDLVAILATRVESLVERFRAAQSKLEALDGQLMERNRQIRELSEELKASTQLKRDVQKRINRLVAHVERLERAS